uniref:tRNA pseudouridine(55) synthase n=1 Tax=Callorhinchus milii TaxID=7868 RepID=A0A4W3H3G5_CALMI
FMGHCRVQLCCPVCLQMQSLHFTVNRVKRFETSDRIRRYIFCFYFDRQPGSLTKDDVLQLKEVYKWLTHPLLSEELGVPVDGKSLFEVSVIFAHPETDGDCHFLASVCRDCFRPTKNKQSVFTRMAVVKALEKIKDDDFRQQFCLWPEAPKTACIAEEIQCSHTPVYVAGRYNKFSRNLPQTPWVIDGERKMESSVEELIAEPLTAMFKSDSFNFSSSGREDVDVRTLGYGRPFAIEVLNPHRWSCTQEEITELQQQINKSTDKIRVRDLQIVTREAVGHMKEGEEEKTKCYSALIWTQRAIERSDINFLQDMMELKLDQKTPLRVLHRRPLAVRFRVIHSMKVDYIDQHHFRLYLKTQAGTYIKEFVHGDFGRTKPNLGILMKTTVDILELDVEVRDVPFVWSVSRSTWSKKEGARWRDSRMEFQRVGAEWWQAPPDNSGMSKVGDVKQAGAC